jgi:hypothetical protein
MDFPALLHVALAKQKTVKIQKTLKKLKPWMMMILLLMMI